MVSVRTAARRVLPLGLRTALRQAPAALRDALRPAPPRTVELSAFPHVQCRRKTPLRRGAAPYGESLQRGKEQNVARAAALVNGATIAPGATFSWHRYVGPPLRMRGFVPGPEVHGGTIAAGLGGGACQVANLVFWLALHAGMEVVERHRHDLDLFPDHDRTAPFGSGATVYYPARDLKFRNPGPAPFLLELRVSEGLLHGAGRFPSDPGVRWELVERDHRFVREGGQVFRENRLWRRRIEPGGAVAEERIGENRARVLYPVPGI